MRLYPNGLPNDYPLDKLGQRIGVGAIIAFPRSQSSGSTLRIGKVLEFRPRLTTNGKFGLTVRCLQFNEDHAGGVELLTRSVFLQNSTRAVILQDPRDEVRQIWDPLGVEEEIIPNTRVRVFNPFAR